jgi:hypothetical protein
VLVGSLCRIENWCDVEEVEELLKEKQVWVPLVNGSWSIANALLCIFLPWYKSMRSLNF